MRKRHILFFVLLCAVFAAFAQKDSCCTKNYENGSATTPLRRITCDTTK